MNVPAEQREGLAAAELTPPARPRVDPRDLDRIFGTTPTSTRDDLPEPGEGQASDNRNGDDWYLENRPPHHG